MTARTTRFGEQVRQVTRSIIQDKARSAIEEYRIVIAEIPAGNDHDQQVEEHQQRLHVFQQRYEAIQVATLNDHVDLKEETLRMGRECDRLSAGLPMYAYQHEIIDTIRRSQVSILIGDTGSGKSTQVCQYLYEHEFWNSQQMIVCTQPRKVAATSLAERVSMEMKTTLGKLVGYQVGMKRKATKHTKILFSTDHCLLNECLKDPLFSQYSVLVIDEAHERSIHTDLLLGLIKKCLLRRPDLKVIITSATIDPTVFQSFFGGCPVVNVPGRMFPVEVFYEQSTFPAANEYCEAIIAKVTQVHREKEAGDILAFLVTPLDCERCSEVVGELEGAVCFPLHGQLSPEKYNEVMAPIADVRRKIVLATNCAETSITIPGIRYVVDSGLAKEKQFDPRANISKLVVSGISKSSADQRKGRAGRVESGECLRLYSKEEYDEMNPIAVPEILRVNLGQAVLSLVALGINDPLSFDFVQSPEERSLRSAHNLLVTLGALDVDGGLSDLGRRMVHLPVDPKFAKFVLLCCDEGFGYGGIVMATMCMQGNQVFYRGTTEEERVESDAKKAKFLDSRGDAFTFLKLFQAWKSQPDQLRGIWCFENSINSKLMNNALRLAQEIQGCLSSKLGITIHREIGAEDVSTIQQYYLACYFPNNLCFYSGNDRIGYFVPQIREYCPIHPSSTLNYCGVSPNVAIFENILETNRKYLITVTEVDAMNQGYGGDWIKTTYREQLVKQYPLSTAGPAVQRDLFYNRWGMKNVMTDIFCSLILTPDLQWSPPKQSSKWVNVVVRESDHQVVSEYLQANCVGPVIAAIRKKKKEFCVGKRSDVKVHLGAGAVVHSCIMPDEFTSVRITLNRPSDYSQLSHQKLLEILVAFGEVINIKQVEQRTTLWGFANFCQPSSAESAVKADFKLFHCVRSNTKSSTVGESDGFRGSIQMEWLRRPSKDHAFVKLPAGLLLDNDFSVESFMLGFTTCLATKNKKDPNNLFLRPVPSDCTDRMIKQNGPAFLRSCKSEIIIPSASAPNTIHYDHEMVKMLMLPVLQECGVSAEALRFLNDRETARFIRCFINLSSITSCLNTLDALNKHRLSYQDRSLKFTATWSYVFNVSQSVYAYLKEDIHELSSLFSSEIRFQSPNKKGGLGRLRCTAADCNDLRKLQAELYKLITGLPFECVGMLTRTLLTRKNDKVLEDVMAQTDTLIEKDARQDRLNIYGNRKNVEKAEHAIYEFLETLASKHSHDSVLCLRGEGRPSGLMKLVLRKHKADLVAMQEVEGCATARLDLRNHEILYMGTPEGFYAIEAEIDRLAEEAMRAKRVIIETPCPICLDEVEEENVQLSLCGHYYCKECFEEFIKSAVKDKRFPLRCSAEDCDQPLCIDDIETTNNLINAAVESFVSKNNDYKFCLTPDCPNIYRATKSSKIYHCSLCLRAVCTCCHKDAHSEDDLCSADPDSHSLVKWMKQDPANRRKCPQCGQGIEKDGGCLHVHCIKCDAHICWKCFKVYASASTVYGHTCPGPLIG